MDKIDYLDDERKKIWTAIDVLQKRVAKYTSEEVDVLTAKAEQIQNAVTSSEAAASRYEEILNKANSAITEISSVEVFAKATRQELEMEAVSAKTSHDAILDATEKTRAISQQAEEVKAVLDEAEASIAAKNELLGEVDQIHSNIDEILQKVKLLHRNILDREKAVTDLHRRVFGYIVDAEGDEEEKKVEGLKDQLDQSYKELSAEMKAALDEVESIKKESLDGAESIQKVWSDKHQELNERIESLLPKAMTAGLSHAYADKKKEEIEDQRRLQGIFNTAISGMVLVSLIPFAIGIYYIMGSDFTLEDVVNRVPKLVTAILPLYIPVLWVAFSSNKKLNLAKRLIEEYSHKEVLSRTYEGLSRQIEGIENENIATELRVKLLYNVLEISAENPGKLITDYNRSDHPIIDVLDRSSKLAEAVDKLARIPGFGKLADKLSRQAKESTEQEAHKAERGLRLNEVGVEPAD
jgi:hypothetical protein